jgi:hypothetical protein
MLELLIYITITILVFLIYLKFFKPKKKVDKFKKIASLPEFDKDIVEEVKQKLSKRKELGPPRKY